jgi:hypothetical protein
VAVSCKHGNKLLGNIKVGEFHDCMSTLSASVEGLYSMEQLISLFLISIFG